jgi:hypothetical protein
MKFKKINTVILSFYLSIIAASNTTYAGLITETQSQSVTGQEFTFSFDVSDWVLGSSSGLAIEVLGDFSIYTNSEYFSVTVEGIELGEWNYQTSDSASHSSADTTHLFKAFDFNSVITDGFLIDDVLEFTVRYSHLVDMPPYWATLQPYITSTFVYNSVDVPEPPTLTIFALGLMGLLSRRFKCKS